MHTKILMLAAGTLLFSTLTLAQGAGITALVGGRLIDGFGGTPLDHSVILIKGERIEAVGTEDSLPIPAGATVIPTGGMSVLPVCFPTELHSVGPCRTIHSRGPSPSPSRSPEFP